MATVDETTVTPASVEAELCAALGCESLDESSRSLIPTAIELSKLSPAASIAANLIGVRQLPERKEKPMDQAEQEVPDEPALTTEADAIRAVLAEAPAITNAEVVKVLANKGVVVTSSQVSAIKRKIKDSQS